MNKIENRIEKIKEEHIFLLKTVRDNITSNKNSFVKEASDVINALEIDEKNIKKYEALVKAQELIASLTEEIVSAKTPSEVSNIRKKLNYYINKIKTELKNRNMDEDKIEKYQEKNQDLKKEIAKYIRFLKREDNINEIERLYSNYENLSNEEINTLKKALSRERNYNTRNMKPPKKTEKNLVKENNKLSYSTSNKDSVSTSETQTNDDKNKLSYSASNMGSIGMVDVQISDDKNNSLINHYFKEKITLWNRQYKILATYDYNQSRISNLIIFFCNIPKNIHNKKAIKLMKHDYKHYYRGYDFASFIEYQTKRNSIKNGLRFVLNKTLLYTDESNCLSNHDECYKWLIEYCNAHGQKKLFIKKYANYHA